MRDYPAMMWRVITHNRKNMYKELTTHDVAHELSSNKDNGFSYNGAYALAEWLEEYEESTGEKTELDTVAIRCDFSEYESAYKAAEDHGVDTMDLANTDNDTEEDMEEAARAWLEERTTVIPFEGGVIIQQF